MRRSLDKTLVEVKLDDGSVELLAIPVGFNEQPSEQDKRMLLEQLEQFMQNFKIPYVADDLDDE